jgi:hypothetical protein
MSRKDNLIAPIDEEPVSSPTPNRQINQAGQEGTRNVGKKHSPSEQSKREHSDKAAAGASPIEQQWSEP